jgi:uncharacterized integral membrane protein
MNKVKISSVMIILMLVVVFTLQNTEQVDVRFLFWQLALSKALMLFLVFALGMLSGFVLNMLKHEARHTTPPTAVG